MAKQIMGFGPPLLLLSLAVSWFHVAEVTPCEFELMKPLFVFVFGLCATLLSKHHNLPEQAAKH